MKDQCVREFDAALDREFIHSGGFFCEGCLTGRMLDNQSPDPRYCQGCYGFLLKEAEILTGRRPSWVPKAPKRKIGLKKVVGVTKHVTQNMATVNRQKTTVAIIQPATPKITKRRKRGPKPRDLPVDLIVQMAAAGVGYKKIAAKLKVEYNIDIGFRTVARIVKGERIQLPLLLPEA